MCTSAGKCECALLWIGLNCETPRPLEGPHLKSPNLGFEGSIVMSKASVSKLSKIELTLPGKEGGGHRVLGPVNGVLKGVLPETDA